MFCKAKQSLRNQCFTTKPTRELRNRCFSHLNDSSCVYLCVFSICVFAQVLRNNGFLLQIQVWRPVVKYPQTTKIVDFDTKLITRSYFQKTDAGGRRHRMRFEKKRIREKTGSEEKQAADTEYDGGWPHTCGNENKSFYSINRSM